MAIDRGSRVLSASGRARVDRRTKKLLTRLQPGDVAVIDHEDLDRLAAEALVKAGVAAVVNAARSISGRYPNVGPLLVAAAGIPLVDQVGSGVLDQVREGELVRVDGAEVWVGGVLVATGARQTLQSREEVYEAARSAIGDELERFAENTLEYLRRERHLMFGSLELPELDVELQGRDVLVVVRGNDYREDLAALRSYVREMRPVLVGVDGGADALLEFGLRPDVIIGDFDSVSSTALCSGAQLIVHGYPGGTAPGTRRLDALGLRYSVFQAPGTSEDIAMLLSYEKRAELIVAVGTHASMIEFLDKGREGMASTFLTRLKVGPILLDAKGVSRLYRARLRKRDLLVFLLAAMACFVVIILMVTPRVFVEGVWLILRDLWNSAFR
jgi:uncharacterized membrane-anchored protein